MAKNELSGADPPGGPEGHVPPVVSAPAERGLRVIGNIGSETP